MAVSLSGAIAGSAYSGFTSPTYTFSVDSPPDALSKQWSCLTIGGTQTGVTTATVSSPFSFTIRRPANFKQAGVPNPSTGVIYPSGKNVWRSITRKGATPAANQSPALFLATTDFAVPAGAETYDLPNITAGIISHIGVLSNQSQGLIDSVRTGVL